MKEIIILILENKNIKIEKEITDSSYELLFTIFNNAIEDYFSIILMTSEELQKMEGIDLDDLISPDILINNILLTFRKDETNNIYDLKNNLSSIILLDCSLNDYPLNKIKKIEDDKFYAKKYVLRYNKTDIEKLKNEIELTANKSTDIGNVLSEILNKHDLLSEDRVRDLIMPNNSWYRLLLDFYIKIPFLNYIVPEQKKLLDLDYQIYQKLGNSSELFDKILAIELNDSEEDFEKKITSIISQ